MAKEITGYVKLQIKGGQANPAPPVGPALGSKGINIMEFCNQFNARTEDRKGQVLPVVIRIYKDKSFDFVIKTPPASVLILQAANKKKGSDQPNLNKVASITSPRLCGAIFVAIPTAIPDAPLTRILGYCAGKTVGSFVVSS